MRKVFITGTAGFIGFHLAQLLLDEGFRVHGFDGVTDYYDVKLKQRRHQMLLQNPHFSMTEGMLEDDALITQVTDDSSTSRVKQVFATRWRIHAPISTATLSVHST